MSNTTSSSNDAETVTLLTNTVIGLAVALGVTTLTSILLLIQLCCFTSRRQRYASQRAFLNCLSCGCCSGGAASCCTCCCQGAEAANATADQLEANARDPRRAPCDPSIKMTIVMTDVECGTELWNKVPDAMEQALSSHIATLRRVIIKAQFKGYEVRPVADGLMIAIVSPVAAVKMAVEMMRRNDDGSGPSSDVVQAIRSAYAEISPASDAAVEQPIALPKKASGAVRLIKVGGHQLSEFSQYHHNSQQQQPQQQSTNDGGGGAGSNKKKRKRENMYQRQAHADEMAVGGGDGEAMDEQHQHQHSHQRQQQMLTQQQQMQGADVSVLPPFEHTAILRMRVGIHVGKCTIIHQQETSEYDYQGDTPELAARLEVMAHGHQILVSQDVVDACNLMYGGDELRKWVQFRLIDELDVSEENNHHEQQERQHRHNDNEHHDDDDDNPNQRLMNVYQVDIKSDEDGTAIRETAVMYPPPRVARAREMTAQELLFGIEHPHHAGSVRHSSSSTLKRTASGTPSSTPEHNHQQQHQHRRSGSHNNTANNYNQNLAAPNQPGHRRNNSSNNTSNNNSSAGFAFGSRMESSELIRVQDIGSGSADGNNNNHHPMFGGDSPAAVTPTGRLSPAAGNPGAGNLESTTSGGMQIGEQTGMFLAEQTFSYNALLGSSSLANFGGGAGGGGGSVSTHGAGAFDFSEFAARFLFTVLSSVPRDMRNKTLTSFLLSWGVKVPAALMNQKNSNKQQQDAAASSGAAAAAGVMSPKKKLAIQAEEAMGALAQLSSKVLRVMAAQDARKLSATSAAGGGGSSLSVGGGADRSGAATPSAANNFMATTGMATTPPPSSMATPAAAAAKRNNCVG